jgi:hypothetical protein
MKPMAHQITDAAVADRALAAALEQIAEIAGVPPNNRPDLIRYCQQNIAAMRVFAYRAKLCRRQ